MRKLIRIRTEAAIHINFRGASRKQAEKNLLMAERSIKKGELEKHEFPSAWGVTKDQLLQETYGKCAYCESPTSVVAYGDVEHYRPKSIYWWLAYCYDNYSASCTLCNQKYKKAKFPTVYRTMAAPIVKSNTTDAWIEANTGIHTPDPLNESEGLNWADFIIAHKSERPLLLDPYLDEPQDYFIWKVSERKSEVKLAARDGNPLAVKMVEAANSSLGLNRKELCKLRFEIYLIYSTSRITAESQQVPQYIRDRNTTVMQRMLHPEAAYSAMVNYFHSMPTQELLALMDAG